VIAEGVLDAPKRFLELGAHRPGRNLHCRWLGQAQEPRDPAGAQGVPGDFSRIQAERAAEVKDAVTRRRQSSDRLQIPGADL